MFFGCALRAVQPALGGRLHVPESGLRVERSTLIALQQSVPGMGAAHPPWLESRFQSHAMAQIEARF
jgi:hypothetical protein